jgi:5-methylcytosine-specific restriction endonuclease McrA
MRHEAIRGTNMAKPIPKKLIKAVLERDDGICQYCGRQGANIHHIAYGGTGRARRHIKENLITLCLECHGAAHRSKEMRGWTYEWSRNRYGNVIDKLLELKWSGEK